MTIKRHTVFIISCHLTLLCLWINNISTLQLWWLEDDPIFLQGISHYGVWAHFYRPEVWQDLMPYHLMPWIILSFGVDWHLFGFDPTGYYWHQFLSFTLVIIIAYKVLRRFFPAWICSSVLTLFVISQPSTHTLQLLMVRHYIEGLGLSLLASWFYIKALHTQQLRWAYLGSLFYLCATTAKEIYVPLIFILPSLTRATWQQRLHKLIPFLVVTGGYVIWRSYMLGFEHLVAGYDNITVPPLTWERIITLPEQLLEILGWHTAGQSALIIFTLLLLINMGLQAGIKNYIVYSIIWLLAVVLPMIPILSILSPLNSRYIFLPTFLVCVSLAFLLRFLHTHYGKFISVGVSALWLAGAVASWTAENPALSLEKLHQNAVEGKFVLTAMDTPRVLFSPYSASWYYDALLWLKQYEINQSDTLRICYDMCVCPLQAGERLFHYEHGELHQIDPVTLTCSQVQTPLEVHFWLQRNTLFWDLPQTAGQYWGALDTHARVMGQFFPIPARGISPRERRTACI